MIATSSSSSSKTATRAAIAKQAVGTTEKADTISHSGMTTVAVARTWLAMITAAATTISSNEHQQWWTQQQQHQ